MKLTRVDLAALDKGLSGTLKRLGKLVVLAGPNGAGKSRILDSVEERSNAPFVHTPAVDLRQQLKLAPQHSHLVRALTLSEAMATEGTNQAIRPFPQKYELRDHRTQNERTQMNSGSAVDRTITKDLHEHMLSYINEAARAYGATFIPNGVADPEAVQKWGALNDVVESVLGERIQTGKRMAASLFGKEIFDASLSQGQKALLQIAVRIHANAGLLDGHILLIDEPETHLHPSVLIDVIDRLRELDGVGQIWIATHSVPLLAALPVESLFYVDSGCASYAGKEPETVLNGLLGGDRGRVEIEEFLRLPAQLASNLFAAECLLPPGVADTGTGDPQAKQLHEVLAFKDEAPRILDYGAGRGRLLVALDELAQRSEESGLSVDYHAYDPEPGVELESRVLDLCGQGRMHTTTDELRTLTKASFDVVIMCNVLHELLPKVWKDAFGRDGHVSQLLKPTGHLIILEDMEIPSGEKAHEYGFLLMDSPQLCELFEISSETGAIKTFKARKGRLKAHAITAESLVNVTHETVCAALRALQRSSLDAANSMLKKNEISFEAGRLYALRCQSHMNATLALKALS